eukprot:GDKJ01039627.1.p1 GENE.GDKJ01039627.1~~GDKJ01039627.1.p1  ORF type:complete len:224 (-),score=-9.35 GDKJ01039627.1:57-728(-)
MLPDFRLTAFEMQTMTGYPHSVFVRLAYDFDIEPSKVVIVAMILHNNWSFDKASILLRQWSVFLSASSLHALFYSVVDTFVGNSSYKPERRFSLYDPQWPSMYSIVDGVPVFCRGDASHYSGKSKSKSVVFQVLVDLAGRPFAWSEGVTGARTDAFAFNLWDPCVHYAEEYIFADLMYMASATALLRGNPTTQRTGMFLLKLKLTLNLLIGADEQGWSTRSCD